MKSDLSLYISIGHDTPHQISRFAWGGFSPQDMQKITYCAKRDEERRCDNTLRDELSKIGTSGAHSENMSRDAFRHMGPNQLPHPQDCRIPIGRGRPEFPFMPPHVLFSTIYHKYRGAFFKVVAPPGEAEKFWAQVKGGPGLYTI